MELAQKFVGTRKGTLFISVIAALIAGGMILVYLQRYRASVKAEAAPVTVLVAAQAIPRGTVMAPLDLCPGRLDEPVVLDTGRAGRHAGHTAKARIEMLHHRRRHGLAIDAKPHQVDPPAWRVHFLVPQRIRGAGRQAEPAMHAIADERR